MLNKIIGTTGTRVLNAFFAVVILYLLANYIGSQGMGVIALIVLGITIIQLVIDLVAGSALIYFASRSNLGQLIFPAYIWIGFVVGVFYLLYLVFDACFPALTSIAVPDGYAVHILALALLSGLMVTHYNLLLGKERIKTYNILFTVQITVMLSVFIFQLFVMKNTRVEAYLSGLYFAYGFAAIGGFFSVVYKAGRMTLKGWQKTTKKVLKYGLVTQTANILNIVNNRGSFYIITHFLGLASLGVYNAGVQLTEGLRVIGQSIAVVQFSTISNTNEPEYARTLTIRLMKLSVLLTMMALLVLLTIPEHIYSLLLTKDFSGVKPVIIALSPGVMALAINNIFSHYFSGMGMPKINLHAKITGLVFTLVLLFILIPAFGIIGAAVTASVSYLATVVHQYIVFKKQTGTRFVEWIPVVQDFREFKTIIREALKKKQEDADKQ
ncbi:MAG: polysaccharide biosynthesis C-terminal domain-containing protein [Bacteroidales bacterium]|nr:polysaccharide biosynthesis C-terminal domain-containing protein [Bacteroidales bacterium]MCF6342145.1 polysaccharide biosynthesis C-terminal domain-containing protein [Bacteroidales bacterium]